MPQLQVHPKHRHWTQQLQTRGQQQAQAQGPSRTWVPSQIPQTRRRRSRRRSSGWQQEHPRMPQLQVHPTHRHWTQQLQTRGQQQAHPTHRHLMMCLPKDRKHSLQLQQLVQ